MKKTKLLSLALATLMLGACSSEDVVVNEGSVPPGGNGYLSFAFNLPTAPSTRANDNFDNGEACEYNVQDATLLLFAGNDEANSKFQGAYNLTLPGIQDNPNYNVTTRYSIVQQVTKPEGNGNVYAMVILNGQASEVVKEEPEGTWTLNGTVLTKNTTFSTLYTTAKEMTLNKIANTSTNGGCFLMTNAPMFTKQGGTSNPTSDPSGQVQTLSVIDRDRIYATEAEAKANPAADIYCERAVAKVTVKSDASSGAGSENGKITAFDFKGWTLDITSKQSFLVRNVAGAPWWDYKANRSTDYRFVGSVGLTNTATQTLYRTYWGIDPTYDGNGYNTTQVDKTHFNTTIGAVPTLTDMGKDAYCLENTFNVANQNQNQTTRVIVAAQLTVDGVNSADHSFFILNDNKDVIYDTEDKIKEIVSTAYMNVPEIRQVLETNLKTGTKLDNSDLTVTFTKPSGNNAGYWTVASITVNNDSKFEDGIPAELTESNPTYTAAIASVNKDYNIAYYAGGVSYYGVRIRHFDDNQTPWTANGEEDSYKVTSGNNENEYLGRYGVLRNNWYEVNVTGIRNIGSPIPDEVYGQDDPQEKWISVRINVLAWAKRSQNVDL